MLWKCSFSQEKKELVKGTEYLGSVVLSAELLFQIRTQKVLGAGVPTGHTPPTHMHTHTPQPLVFQHQPSQRTQALLGSG